MYVPESYGVVFPYMIVSDADAFEKFLFYVFGASEVGRTMLPTGRIANIRIRIGSSTFMVSEAANDWWISRRLESPTLALTVTVTVK